MQTSNEKTTVTLKTLIIINNDRYEGYKTVAGETRDQDLKTLFTSYSEQARLYAKELENLLPLKNVPTPKESMHITAKLYRVWTDIKSAIIARNKSAIISAFEFGEETALMAYDEALLYKNEIPVIIIDEIRRQRNKIKEGYDKVRDLSQAHPNQNKPSA